MSEMTIGKIVTTFDPTMGRAGAPRIVLDEEALRKMIRRLIVEVANEMREQGLLR